MKTKKAPINYLVHFEPGYIYHVYNRTNNKEKLFFTDADRHRFLSRYWQYLPWYVHTYTYCLLGNHFHFLIRVKTIEEITRHISMIRSRDRTAVQRKFLDALNKGSKIHTLISSQFNRLFTAYAMYFNKARERHGNLFHRPFKRLVIQNEAHFTHVIYYIHANPVKHGLTFDFKVYPWNSYQLLLSNQQTKLERKSIMEYFGGKEAFLEFHNRSIHFDSRDKWEIED